jgi:hypothetical protein
METLQTPCAEFIAKELRTPDVDNIFSPSSHDGGAGEFW